jgi:hypothetical protein
MRLGQVADKTADKKTPAAGAHADSAFIERASRELGNSVRSDELGSAEILRPDLPNCRLSIAGRFTCFHRVIREERLACHFAV